MTIAVTTFLGVLAALFLSAPCMALPGTFLGLDGSQLPVCIRDMEILLGSLAGCAASCFFLDRLRGRNVLIADAVLLLVTGVQWALQGAVGDHEAIRFVSGIGASVIFGWWIVGLTGCRVAE